MQPMLVIDLFKGFIEAVADEFVIEDGEGGENAGKELFEGER